jgi:hypothetical protein
MSMRGRIHDRLIACALVEVDSGITAFEGKHDVEGVSNPK